MHKLLRLALVILPAIVAICVSALFVASGPSANPQEAARLNNLGVAYMNQQLFEKALRSFEEAAAADSSLEIAKVNHGIALLNLQRLDQAKAILEEAVKTDPKDAHAWYNLGLLYKNSTDARPAVDAFRRVTELDSDDADAWYFLGSTYAQLKQYPEALAAFGHALKINPQHASAEFGLARTYQQSGQADLAHEAMKNFQYITEKKLGSPISLAYGEQGKYSRAEDSPLVPQKVPPQIEVRFAEVTKEAGIISKPRPAVHIIKAIEWGPGACFLDYDNDGKLDLFIGDNGPVGGMALYHNVGGGRFEDVTQTAGFDPGREAEGCTSGDYDNDGYPDLVVSSGVTVRLFHNLKDGTFKDATKAAGILPSAAPVEGIDFVDYDHDGDLDLYATVEGAEDSGNRTATRVAIVRGLNRMWRNNGNGTFADDTEARGLEGNGYSTNSIATDYNNDRAVDLVVTGGRNGEVVGGVQTYPPLMFMNPREGKFRQNDLISALSPTLGVAALDFDHDGWMDLAFTHDGAPGVTLWRNDRGKSFEQVKLPETNWVRGYGIVAFDYDNDGWVDLAAVGETKTGKGEVRLFRNLGLAGWKDVTADVGLDRIQLTAPRAIVAGDYDNDGAVDLLITQNHAPAVLLRNLGGNKNNSLRLALKGLSDNKSAIGTKVEVFSDGIRQKFEVYGSSGYLGQNSPYLTIGLGQAKQADVVRLRWPTGVLQDEIEIAANQLQTLTELDRRGSSCPTLFAWDGERYRLVGDMLGAGVIGHWMAAHGDQIERNVPRPTEAIKVDPNALREKDARLSFRFMEPLEESVYLDSVELLAVDHPADLDVYPNEYFASAPPYPPFKVVSSHDAQPPAEAWDEHGHNVLPDLIAHRYFGDFKVLPFLGFAEPHTLELDLGPPYRGGPLWLLMHGEIEYFSANSMYAADQAGLRPVAPYVEALVPGADSSPAGKGKWVRVVDDLGFPAGGARTMTADLSGKLPVGTRRIRVTTNLQIYWDNILISRTGQHASERITPVPLARANLAFHGFPLKIEDQPPGNVKYIYEQTSASGPYTRPAGAYTRYGNVRELLTAIDDKFVVFGSGDEVALDFDPSALPALPHGWTRDYFFVANGYEKDMDFYAYHGDSVDPLPFGKMLSYPYPGQKFPLDAEHLDYLLEFNTRFMSGDEAKGYSFQYPKP
jgi:Tfp pilus assembly protein PilF